MGIATGPQIGGAPMISLRFIDWSDIHDCPVLLDTVPLELPSGEEIEAGVPIERARVRGHSVRKHVTASLHQAQLATSGRNFRMLEVNLVH
ncbi:hypothetical protein ACE10Z_33595 [Bradyrhizobium sp. Pha-3]|uniref:hypothetical protein n=1 Tax=Bradyrhizobium sp. Pha-3 TaxID=208375 RepID=UPI0035D3E9B9